MKATRRPRMAARRSAALARWRRGAVRRMAASREAMLALVARLPAREVLRPRTLDRWSVKDVLVHLLSCDEETLRRFRLLARGQGDRIYWFESMADADRFNARSVARGRGLGLPTVLRRLARARAAMIEQFQRLPTAALDDPSHAYPVVDWLPAPGWSHERDHASEIRSWWRAQSSRRRPRTAGR
jgi:DinB family protein